MKSASKYLGSPGSGSATRSVRLCRDGDCTVKGPDGASFRGAFFLQGKLIGAFWSADQDHSGADRFDTRPPSPAADTDRRQIFDPVSGRLCRSAR